MCKSGNLMDLPKEIQREISAHLHFADMNALSAVSKSLRETFQPIARDEFNHVVRLRADAMFKRLVEKFTLSDNEETSTFRDVLMEYCRTYWEIVSKQGPNAAKLEELKRWISGVMAKWSMASHPGASPLSQMFEDLVVWFIEDELVAQLRAEFPLQDPNNNNSNINPASCPGGCTA